jgi:hypothetical protein
MNSIRSLCYPALLFLVISFIHIIITPIYSDDYSGCFKEGICESYYKHLGVSIVYIIVSTLILNVVCSYGYNIIAWLLFIGLIIYRYVDSISFDIRVSDRFYYT